MPDDNRFFSRPQINNRSQLFKLWLNELSEYLTQYAASYLENNAVPDPSAISIYDRLTMIIVGLRDSMEEQKDDSLSWNELSKMYEEMLLLRNELNENEDKSDHQNRLLSILSNALIRFKESVGGIGDLEELIMEINSRRAILFVKNNAEISGASDSKYKQEIVSLDEVLRTGTCYLKDDSLENLLTFSLAARRQLSLVENKTYDVILRVTRIASSMLMQQLSDSGEYVVWHDSLDNLKIIGVDLNLSENVVYSPNDKTHYIKCDYFAEIYKTAIRSFRIKSGDDVAHAIEKFFTDKLSENQNEIQDKILSHEDSNSAFSKAIDRMVEVKNIGEPGYQIASIVVGLKKSLEELTFSIERKQKALSRHRSSCFSK